MDAEEEKNMVDFECTTCGEREEVDVLPGKHAVLGAASNLERKADCCHSPEYVDRKGFRENMVDRDLRGIVSAFRA